MVFSSRGNVFLEKTVDNFTQIKKQPRLVALECFAEFLLDIAELVLVDNSPAPFAAPCANVKHLDFIVFDPPIVQKHPDMFFVWNTRLKFPRNHNKLPCEVVK